MTLPGGGTTGDEVDALQRDDAAFGGDEEDLPDGQEEENVLQNSGLLLRIWPR